MALYWKERDRIEDGFRCAAPDLIVEIRLLNAGKLQRRAILVDGILQPTRFPGVSIQVETIWPR